MKKLNATLSLIAIVLASLTFGRTTLAQQPPDNVQGNWTIYSTSINDGSTVIKHVQIAQYGNRITGYFEGPDQAGAIQGEVKGNFIRFSTVTRTILNFHGHVFGDNMSGDYGIHGKQAPWQAVRTMGIGAPPQAMMSYGQSMLPHRPLNRLPRPPRRSSNYSQSSNESQASNFYVRADEREATRRAQVRHRHRRPSRRTNSTSLVAPIALYRTLLLRKFLRRPLRRTK